MIRVALGVVALCVVAYAAFVAPPPASPVGMVQVAVGSGVGEVAAQLKGARAVLSPLAFRLAVVWWGGTVQAGPYALGRENVFALAYRMTHGVNGLDEVRVVVPEGATVRDIEALLNITISREHEGYLFPDTYEFLPGVTADVVVARMRARYEEMLAPLRDEIAASGRTEAEIIVMASILEKEARQPETMQVVAGILWDRIKIGMALQVDAVFGYIKGVPTFHPSGADLDIDSPYNTYKYRGLPPGPIGNPGINAIQAALRPTDTPYLYYLTGTDGTMHYARTFEQHIDNRRYLK